MIARRCGILAASGLLGLVWGLSWWWAEGVLWPPSHSSFSGSSPSSPGDDLNGDGGEGYKLVRSDGLGAALTFKVSSSPSSIKLVGTRGAAADYDAGEKIHFAASHLWSFADLPPHEPGHPLAIVSAETLGTTRDGREVLSLQLICREAGVAKIVAYYYRPRGEEPPGLVGDVRALSHVVLCEPTLPDFYRFYRYQPSAAHSILRYHYVASGIGAGNPPQPRQPPLPQEKLICVNAHLGSAYKISEHHGGPFWERLALLLDVTFESALVRNPTERISPHLLEIRPYEIHVFCENTSSWRYLPKTRALWGVESPSACSGGGVREGFGIAIASVCSRYTPASHGRQRAGRYCLMDLGTFLAAFVHIARSMLGAVRVLSTRPDEIASMLGHLASSSGSIIQLDEVGEVALWVEWADEEEEVFEEVLEGTKTAKPAPGPPLFPKLQPSEILEKYYRIEETGCNVDEDDGGSTRIGYEWSLVREAMMAGGGGGELSLSARAWNDDPAEILSVLEANWFVDRVGLGSVDGLQFDHLNSLMKGAHESISSEDSSIAAIVWIIHHSSSLHQGLYLQILEPEAEPGLKRTMSPAFEWERVNASARNELLLLPLYNLHPEGVGLAQVSAGAFCGNYAAESGMAIAIPLAYWGDEILSLRPDVYRMSHLQAGQVAYGMQLAAAKANLASSVLRCFSEGLLQVLLGLRGLGESGAKNAPSYAPLIGVAIGSPGGFSRLSSS